VSDTGRYGIMRIRRGVGHFMLGKIVSVPVGFFYLVLVVRGLNVNEFAAYSILEAFVYLFSAVAGLGLIHAALRYIPELYGKHYHLAFKQLTLTTILLHTLSLSVFAGLAFVLVDPVSEWVGLGHESIALKVYLLAVLIRATSHVISQILESVLCQGLSQAGFTAGSIAKLVLLASYILYHPINLVSVIWIEVTADILTLLILLSGLVHILRQKPPADVPADDASWLNTNFKRLLRFGIAGYLQHLAVIPYAGSFNRLLGGHYLNPAAMASFGFSLSIYDYLIRYLPAQLLLGVIRPVLISRFARTHRFSDLVSVVNLVFKINVYLLGFVLVPLASCGPEFIVLLSGGKYGLDSFYLLWALLLKLILDTARQQLDTLAQITEHNAILVKSNVLLTLSVLPGIALMPAFGALTLPLANAIGQAASMHLILTNLARHRHVYRHDWPSMARVTSIVILSSVGGVIIKIIGGDWITAGACATVLYLFLCPLIGMEDMRAILEFLRNTGDRSQSYAASPAGAPSSMEQHENP
jgi:O-antigen/teichoic acid export membrane protein